MKRVLPPTYFFLAIVAAAGFHFLAPGCVVIPWPWKLIGCLGVGGGAALTGLTEAAFKRHGTTIKPFEESSALMTSGPFRFSRNPMYLGIALILAGIATLFGSLTPWFAVVAFCVLIDRRFIRVEESMMEATFGEPYREYKKRVRRWI